MGREVRRVPPDWKHPKPDRSINASDDFQPMHDRDFDTAMQRWLDGLEEWRTGGMEKTITDHPELADAYRKEPIRGYVDWDAPIPDPDYHRPKWSAEEATAYQVYETVTEGTPCSPVFATKTELIDWLSHDHPGYPDISVMSEEGAKNFVDNAWAPTFVAYSDTGLISGVEAISMGRLYKEKE